MCGIGCTHTGNSIGAEGAKHIGDGMKTCTNITSLDLRGTLCVIEWGWALCVCVVIVISAVTITTSLVYDVIVHHVCSVVTVLRSFLPYCH